MDKISFLRLLHEFKEMIDAFEEGDLIKLTEVKIKFYEIFNFLSNNKTPKKSIDLINTLYLGFNKIINSADQKSIILKIHEFIFEMTVGKSKPDKIKESFNKIIQTIDTKKDSQEKPSELHKEKEKEKIKITETNDSIKELEAIEDNIKKELYTSDYFSNLTDDLKMLSKYCDEAKEHLDNAQLVLIDLEYDSSNQENLNSIFRCFHTIKSSSAFLGVKNIEEVSHEVENLLVLVRDGNLSISSELIDVIFFGISMVRNLIDIIESSGFKTDEIIINFESVNIYNYIDILKKILANYKTKKIGEILEESGKIDSSVIEKILDRQINEKKKFGEIALEEKAVSEEDLKNALKKQTVQQKRISYVKVSNERLNFLIDMVGELVVTQSIIKSNIKSISNQSYSNERDITQLESITTSIKNVVLSMGMVPISEIFNKLKVVIRNASRELNKMIDVEIHGEETELDRNVIESIYDPLIHIVRNSLDHGIESKDERIQKNKKSMGKIIINACHKGSFIEISITDDGKGINKDKIIKKARDLNLIQNESELTEKDIYNLMFIPGFSTAEKVTEISGRGVGLDVVKKNIEQINGKVEIHSELGKYTKFIIKIPLTLAIIDGFVTIVNNKKYIFPFSMIEEIIAGNLDLNIMNEDEIMLNIRNKFIPVISAGRIFEENYTKNLSEAAVILINYESNTYGIAVDEVVGKQEIVIKNLNAALHGLKFFSGGTIFGDGTIGFVVNVDKFIENAKAVTKLKTEVKI